LARPGPDVEEETLARTALALGQRTEKHNAALKAKSIAPMPNEPTYIKYVPEKQGPEYNSGASHRIIKMHETQVQNR
jgi:hypothetical protein